MSDIEDGAPVEPQIQLVAGNVKAAMKEAGASSGDLWKVPRSMIRVIDGFNVRSPKSKKGKEHVKNLAALIEANGFDPDKPLAGYVAKEDGADIIYLTDGEHRLDAVDLLIAKGIEFDSLPVIVKPRGTSMEDLTISLATGNSGKPLTPLELGTVIKRLLGYQMDEKTISKRLGITRKYLDDLLTLMASPAEIRTLVEADKVSASLAITTIKENPAKAVTKLQAAVAKVEAAGKTKVTPKNMKPAKAEKHVNDLLVDRLAKAIRKQLAVKEEAGKTGWATGDIDALYEGADKHVHFSTAESRLDHIIYLAMIDYRLSEAERSGKVETTPDASNEDL